ncbi:unnamed protein product [Candidula unifasciata]|uniref:G-protein coupled receptors family 1 profile domain-containing protein n=1 Tax=Candidula unifasciata TaxID=100452 RepID=A0A8S3Z2Y3_9EUPU|nr:unnamed protein product [Candidula unifasciata]
MSQINVTQFVESIIYPPTEERGFNSSIYPDIADYDDVNTWVGDDNRTQLLLSNGTRTKVFYTCPIILAVGMLSNLMAYLVFTRTRLRKVPSVPYLAAMAVVDSGALLTEFIQNGIALHGIHIIVLSGVCQYTTYFSYIFIFLCIWYPIALGVEKFISVYYPLRKAALCTTFRAKVVVISMFVMTGTCYYYVIYMTGPISSGPNLICQVWDFFRKDFYNLMMLDYIFTFVFPSMVLIVLLILICGRGCEYYRISSTIEVSSRPGSIRNSSNRAPVRVTNVIFPIILVILLLKFPTGLLRMYATFNSSSRTQLMIDLQNVFLYLGRFEWVIKFYVYLIFSPSFRRRTKAYVCSVRSKLKGGCDQDSIEDGEIEGIVDAPRINLPETAEREGNPRTFLMTSDV